MKAIGILWNSMEKHIINAINDIYTKARINDYIIIDFKMHFKDFIGAIYPYEGSERWKLDYKINAMNDRYDSNTIVIVYLDIPVSKEIYIERKHKMVYESVENLKNYIRSKYSKLIEDYSFDNVFHMTDNKEEYIKTLSVIKKFMVNEFKSRRKGFVNLNSYISYEKIFLPYNEKNGKRAKFWFCDFSFLYKYECGYGMYAELLAAELAKLLGINNAVYIPSQYQGKYGLITVNFVEENEQFIDGSHLIDAYLCGNNNSELQNSIEVICKYNNLTLLSQIVETYCLKNGLIYDCFILTNLKKVFVLDIILLQPDRTPNNWGIIIKKNKHIKLAPLYDNANCLGAHKDFFDKANSLDLFYKLPTLLLEDSKHSIFESKDCIIRKIKDNDLIRIFDDYLENINKVNLVAFIKNTERLYKIKFPESFKEKVVFILSQHLKNMKNIIHEDMRKF